MGVAEVEGCGARYIPSCRVEVLGFGSEAGRQEHGRVGGELLEEAEERHVTAKKFRLSEGKCEQRRAEGHAWRQGTVA
jgi:hypothetical protein